MATFNPKLEDSVQTQINILATTIKKKLALSEIKKKSVADETGLSVNTINNCLRGQNVNIASLLKIAYVLGMNFRQLAEEVSHCDMPEVQGSMRSVSIKKVQEVMKDTGTSEEQMEWRLGVDSKANEIPELFLEEDDESIVASILTVSDIIHNQE